MADEQSAWLDQEDNPLLAVPDPAALFADWNRRSAATREASPHHSDISYGPSAGQVLMPALSWLAPGAGRAHCPFAGPTAHRPAFAQRLLFMEAPLQRVVDLQQLDDVRPGQWVRQRPSSSRWGRISWP